MCSIHQNNNFLEYVRIMGKFWRIPKCFRVLFHVFSRVFRLPGAWEKMWDDRTKTRDDYFQTIPLDYISLQYFMKK